MSGIARRRIRRPAWMCALALAVALTVSLFTGAAFAAGDGTVPSYRTDVAHDNVQVDPSFRLPLALNWSKGFANLVSYPLIVEGKIFVVVSDYPNSFSTTLYALDRVDGHQVWSATIPSPSLWAGIAYENGSVFAVNSSGTLYAFESSTGASRWSTRLTPQYSFRANPTASGGVVYVSGSGSGGTLYAVDEATGTILTRASVANGDFSSPTVGPSGVYVSYACNQTYMFTPIVLQPVWHHSGPCSGGGGETAVYTDGRLLTLDFFGNLVLDALTGAVQGTWAGLSARPPAADGANLYWIENGTLVARTTDGNQAWSFVGDGTLMGIPTVVKSGAGNLVVAVSAAGMVYALDQATGTELWSQSTGFSFPGYSTIEPGFAVGQGVLAVSMGSQLLVYGEPERVPPTVIAPAAVTARASALGTASVAFDVSATDNVDPSPVVSCSPSSGAAFGVGVTAVTCSARDRNGNVSADVAFPVVVSAYAAQCDLARYPTQKGVIQLRTANLAGCFLPGAALAGANATSANMYGTYLAGASLVNATLTGVTLERAVLRNANLSGARLNGANLRGADLRGATLTGVTWSNTTCPDGTNSNTNGGSCLLHL